MLSRNERKFKEQIFFSALDFFKRDFEVSNAEIAKILNVKTADVRRWFSEGRVFLNGDEDLKMRITMLIGIHWNLISMFSRSKNRMIWLKTSHPDIYGRQSPLEHISRPGGLPALNSYTSLLVSQGA